MRATLHERLLRQGVTITPLTTPVEIHSQGVRVVHVLTDEEREIAADSDILSSSGVAEDTLYHALAAHAKAGDSDLEQHLIGVALAPRHLRHAMVDGAHRACRLRMHEASAA